MKIGYYKKDPSALLDLLIYDSFKEKTKRVSSAKYHVFCIHLTFEEYNEVSLWLKENCKDVYIIQAMDVPDYNIQLIFRTSSDKEAVLFRLSWL